VLGPRKLANCDKTRTKRKRVKNDFLVGNDAGILRLEGRAETELEIDVEAAVARADLDRAERVDVEQRDEMFRHVDPDTAAATDENIAHQDRVDAVIAILADFLLHRRVRAAVELRSGVAIDERGRIGLGVETSSMWTNRTAADARRQIRVIPPVEELIAEAQEAGDRTEGFVRRALCVRRIDRFGVGTGDELGANVCGQRDVARDV